MGAYILCHEKRAETPYYIEAAGIRVWTIEELCYFICQYAWLLDASFVSEELCGWIDRELQMPKLAKQLYAEYYRGRSLRNFIAIVLNNTGYAGKTEIYRLIRLLDGMEHVTEMERLKQKGDYLLRGGKYRRAIGMYNRILSMRRNNELPEDFYGRVWNNKGMAYAGLFLFDEAVRCMLRAYEEQKTDRARDAYLGALFLAAPEELAARAADAGIGEEAAEAFLKKVGQIVPERGYVPAERLRDEYVSGSD